MIAALLLAAAAPSVVDADVAFARLARARGQWTAFRATAAGDALLFTPQPEPVRDALKDAKDPATAAHWWPTAAWRSCDRTLGVTTGDAIWPDGHASRYTTIWRRQADGGWRWVYDHGEDVAAAEPAPAVAPHPVAGDCARRMPPATFVRDPDARQGVGASDDNSLAYWWHVERDGRHRLVVRQWDGAEHAVVHSRAIAPPASR